MDNILIKPYEISVWDDIYDNTLDRFVERKIAIIGSNVMTGLNAAYNPVFHKKLNGEKTLTFSLKYKYYDPYLEQTEIINPFTNLLVNERKVKLFYDNEWYEFIIKDHTESSDGLEWIYTCTDAFILELSKSGYNLTFDTELNNNQGTAVELATKTLENTDWRLKETDPLKQFIAEPIYKAQLIYNNSLIIKNIDTEEVKKEFDKRVKEIKKELKDLDKEKALKIAKKKGTEIKKKADELVELAKEKGTPVVKKTAEELRVRAIDVTKEVVKKLEKMEIK